VPVAGESFKRAAAARALKPSSRQALNRARSASGNGADMTYPPMKDESQKGRPGNPLTLGSAETL
ncbi:hypothetical protein ACEPPZ_15110, partial [Paracoccus yeei]|uniref:hypothetical protein n=1 Tax=Paracoccus yeei TaxID=147645 RepID=UPI0037D4821B